MEDKILAKILADSFYGRVDPRRRQEISDARMISEDTNAMANLSPMSIHQTYNQDRFKHDALSAGSPVWKYSEVGFKDYNGMAVTREEE